MIDSRHSKATPPGYAAADAGVGLGKALFEWWLPAIFLPLALDQLLVVQPDLYLRGTTSIGPAQMRWLLVGCGLIGWFRGPSQPALAWIVASLGLAASGPLHFWAFGHGHWAQLAASVPSAIGVFASVAAVRQTWTRSANATVRRLAVGHLLHPVVAPGLLLCLGLGNVATSALGPLRASLGVAGGFALVALNPRLDREPPSCRPFQPERDGSRGRWLSWFATFALLAYCGGAVAIEGLLPLHRVLSSSHPIVHYADSDRCSLVVTSGQGAYHVFVDDELRFSTFDERRWAESLVKPALARSRAPRRALVLSTGEGLIERELLKDPEVQAITSVVRCPLVPEFAQRSAWLRQLNASAMRSPRVRVVGRDPAVYLAQGNDLPFDIVIVDLPDPSGPYESKYYSRYFYGQLAARMTPEAILVVQATSARRSPRTFATIGATLQSVGFAVQPAMVPLISRGEWSLYFASLSGSEGVPRPEWQADSLAATTPGLFFEPWPDTIPPKGFVAVPSRLHDATVLDWFERESANGVSE